MEGFRDGRDGDFYQRELDLGLDGPVGGVERSAGEYDVGERVQFHTSNGQLRQGVVRTRIRDNRKGTCRYEIEMVSLYAKGTLRIYVDGVQIVARIAEGEGI